MINELYFCYVNTNEFKVIQPLHSQNNISIVEKIFGPVFFFFNLISKQISFFFSFIFFLFVFFCYPNVFDVKVA